MKRHTLGKNNASNEDNYQGSISGLKKSRRPSIQIKMYGPSLWPNNGLAQEIFSPIVPAKMPRIQLLVILTFKISLAFKHTPVVGNRVVCLLPFYEIAKFSLPVVVKIGHKGLKVVKAIQNQLNQLLG